MAHDKDSVSASAVALMGFATLVASELREGDYSLRAEDARRMTALFDRKPTREEIIAFEAMVRRAFQFDVDAPRVARTDRFFGAMCMVGLLVRSESAKVDREAAGERVFRALKAYEDGVLDQQIMCGHSVGDLIGGFDPSGRRLVTKCGACLAEASNAKKEAERG